MPGVDVDACLVDIATFGCHLADAHIRITEQTLQADGSDDRD
ncbi:hypothetical protein [Cognatilysobacter segetis]|nr:hypothetical protein [Lysobacter segetis]